MTGWKCPAAATSYLGNNTMKKAKRQLAVLTFEKWQRNYDKAHHTLTWLKCSGQSARRINFRSSSMSAQVLRRLLTTHWWAGAVAWSDGMVAVSHSAWANVSSSQALKVAWTSLPLPLETVWLLAACPFHGLWCCFLLPLLHFSLKSGEFSPPS